MVAVSLRTVLKSGSSKPWPEVLQEALGTNRMDASSLMKYFDPIIQWLAQQNKEQEETIGWPDFNWVPPVPEGYPEDIGKIGVGFCSILFKSTVGLNCR